MDTILAHRPRDRSRVNPAVTARPAGRDPASGNAAAGRTAAGSFERKDGRLSGRTIRYIESLKIGQGRLAGEPFKVLTWQRRFLEGALAPDIGEAALSLARGGGKSTLIAAIGCAALDGPLAWPGGEVLIVASSHEQGQIIFRHCQRFLAARIEAGAFRQQDTVNSSRLVNRATGAILMVKGSDPKRLHGAAPALVLADELAQWPAPRIGEMLAALRTAAGKIPGCRLLMIGTRPADETHPFAVALQQADYCQVHAAKPDEPLFQRRTWKRANPGLDHMPDLEAAIRREAKAAKQDPALLAQFKALRLNLGTHDTARDLLVTPEAWRELLAMPDAPAEGVTVWGVDLGSGQAMSAVACCWASGRVETLAAFGSHPPLDQRALQDGAGGLYRAAQDAGELIISDRRVPDVAALFRAAEARFGGRPARIVVDRWRLAELRDALDDTSWQAVPVIVARPRIQGRLRRREGMALRRRRTPDQSRAAVRIAHGRALAEAVTMSDPAGNEKLAKGSESGRRMRAKDDCAAAAVLATAHMLEPAPPPSGAKVWGII